MRAAGHVSGAVPRNLHTSANHAHRASHSRFSCAIGAVEFCAGFDYPEHMG
jgi:hypothetical protein